MSKTILRRIEEYGPGSTWTYADFKGLSFIAVSKALSRLAKEKKLVRVRKGVYHYPKPTILGPSISSSSAVIEATFPATYAGTATAAYNLGLTTQVPAGLVLFGDVSYGKANIVGTNVRFRRRNVSHLKNLDTRAISIIETLRNIKKIPSMTPMEIVTKIKTELKASTQVRELIRALQYEPPRVRALIGAICEELGLEKDRLETLYKSLNPLTHYLLGVNAVLSFGHKWNIR